MAASEPEITPVCYVDDHVGWGAGVLSDEQIRHLALDHGMIEPFEPEPVREVKPQPQPDGLGIRAMTEPGRVEYYDPSKHNRPRKVISYGLTSYGYDMRVCDEWRVFTPTGRNIVVDPKDMDPRSFVEVKGEGSVVIPPNSFVLARSVERFNMPPDVVALVVGKSTYARCGIVVNCTPLEPGWCGFLTVEISNTTPLPARIHGNEGIAQVMFFKGSRPCKLNYANKNKGQPGKYQDQPPEIIAPRM